MALRAAFGNNLGTLPRASIDISPPSALSYGSAPATCGPRHTRTAGVVFAQVKSDGLHTHRLPLAWRGLTFLYTHHDLRGVRDERYEAPPAPDGGGCSRRDRRTYRGRRVRQGT